MHRRISRADLQAVVDRINRLTNNPAEPYRGEHGRWTANVGNYHLSGAYGGHALHQMQCEGGSTRDVLRTGHVSARSLFDRMHAYADGIADQQIEWQTITTFPTEG